MACNFILLGIERIRLETGLDWTKTTILVKQSFLVWVSQSESESRWSSICLSESAPLPHPSLSIRQLPPISLTVCDFQFERTIIGWSWSIWWWRLKQLQWACDCLAGGGGVHWILIEISFPEASQSSGAVWESRWPSWAPRPKGPYGFCGRKAT